MTNKQKELLDEMTEVSQECGLYDKQIIIDSVDVSNFCLVCYYDNKTNELVRIEQYNDNDSSMHSDIDSYEYGYSAKIVKPEEIIKQLQAEKQEYEELRQYHNKCCEENAKKLEEWLEKYNQVSRDFFSGKYCDKENCNLLKAKEQECERLKWYMQEIRNQELSYLDIEWDEYETHCIDTEYSNIINLVEEALEERSPEDCRYEK